MLTARLFKNAIMEWLTENGLTNVKSVKFTDDFRYDLDTHIVKFGMWSLYEIGDWFEEYLCEHGCKYVDIPKPILAFLHEVGHSETIDNFSNEEIAWCHILKKTTTDKDTYKETAYRYWSIPDEAFANEWVVNFINTHIEAIMDLYTIYEYYYEETRKEFKSFYNKKLNMEIVK